MSAMRKLNRRDFLRLSAAAATGAVVAACAPAAPQVVEVEKPVVIEKEVVKEVPVEKIVEKEVIKEVPVEKIVEVTAKPAEVATVRWLARTSLEGQDAYRRILHDYFEVEHPYIRVNIEPSPGGWQEKLITSMIAGTAADIFQAWPAIFHNFVERDLVFDIQPYVDEKLTAEEIADYLEAQWEALHIRGVFCGLPKYIDSRLEIINLDAFDEAGVEYPPKDGDWDYTDFEEIAIKNTRDRNGDGKIDIWGACTGRGGWFYWPRNFGGGYVNPDDDTDCWLDEPTSMECFNWIYHNQWEREPNILIREADGGCWTEELVSELVADCEMGLYPGETATAIGDAFRWDYRMLPRGTMNPPAQGGADRCTLGDADGWAIWKGSPNAEAAFEVIHFLSGPIFQEEAILKVNGLIPIRKSLVPVMERTFREAFPALEDVYLEVFGAMMEAGIFSNVYWFKNHVEAMEIINPAYEAVFGVGEKDPTYFKEICAKVEEIQK